MNDVILTREQREAVGHLLSFPKRVQTLGGYAGTGKTTVIKELARRLPRYAVCAFTGKAANVLQRNGVSASTIHSLIYSVDEEWYFDREGVERVRIVFGLRRSLICEGIIVDEASMVSEQLYRDLLSFGLPVIFVGDHGQLEPVADKFDVMRNPDLKLETIHRNANEIAHFAAFVRRGNRPADWPDARKRMCLKMGRRVRFLRDFASASDVEGYGQIIVGYNKTRVAINRAFRQALFDDYGDMPRIGDRVMCLKNNASAGLFNGMQGVVGKVDYDELRFEAQGRVFHVEYDPAQFNKIERPEFHSNSRLMPFDYSYAVTCHKAQGDEWDRVLVMEERCAVWDNSRWAYTAATRAKTRLDWIPASRRR